MKSSIGVDILVCAPHFKDKFPYIYTIIPDARIHVLSTNIFLGYRFLRYIARQYFPYGLYTRIQSILGTNTIAIRIDGKPLEVAYSGITIFLCDWTIENSLFRRLLPFLPNLKWVHSMATGIDHLICPELKEREIILTNVGNVHSERVAEFILSLILAQAKSLYAHKWLQDRRQWRSLPAIEVRGKTLGIVGFGGIGGALSRKAQALGMKIVAVRKRPDRSPETFSVYRLDSLDRLLQLSDFVVLCVPLTEETLGLLGERELKAMKPTAFLINVSRGPIIQRPALIKALKEGWIAGVALDVTNEEPLPRSSPLYSLSALVLTHKSSSRGGNSAEQNFTVFLKNLERFVLEKPLRNVIDIKRGY